MKKIIAAARSREEYALALESDVDTVFMLAPDIADIKAQADMAHNVGKKYFMHIDLAEGVGKDEAGILFVKGLGVDGIISTRTNLIKLAKKAGVFTVQRFFIVDSRSVETTVEAAGSSKADMIEIMPGVVPKIISRLKSKLEMPIVVGGLIESEDEIRQALDGGAHAVSVSKRIFWREDII